MGLWIKKRHTLKYKYKIIHVQADNETKSFNIFQFIKTVQVVEQYAEIIEAVAISNITDVYLDVSDGTVTKNLTAPGADMSGVEVDCFFSKIENNLEPIDVHNCDEVKYTEVKSDEIGQPFILTAKSGVENHIRFNCTTNTVLDFKFRIIIGYRIVDGGQIF